MKKMNYYIKIILLVIVLARTGSCNFSSKPQQREHKIHNIVLYPDKHSWCTTTAIEQVVSYPGCNSVKMDNNVCVGACFSYIVPRTFPETPGDVLPYCDSCQPGHTTWKKVTLECAEGNYKNQTLTKFVEFIHDCNCGTCKDRLIQKKDLEIEDSFESGFIDESFNGTTDAFIFQGNDSSANSSSSALNLAISGLLKKLNTEDENVLVENTEAKGLHKNVWKSLMEKAESIDGSAEQDVFSKLVKTVEEEAKVKFNYKRLKQALLKFKKYQDVTKKNKPLGDNLAFPKDPATNLFASGLYSKLSPKLPPSGIEHETASPMLDVAPQYLKPATSGSEISYHDNLEETNSHKSTDKASEKLV